MKDNWTLDDMPDQTGKTVLITGANDGLGFHLTMAFAQKNAGPIIMACRDLAKAESAREAILKRCPEAELAIVRLDLGDLASVEACAETVLADYDRLDILMCNAGVMAVPFGKTQDDIELHMGVNYYGHFALVGKLMQLIENTPGARVVTTTSLAEKFGRLDLENPPTEGSYNRWFAYGDSKLAMLTLGLMLDEKFKREGIEAKGLSAHPGFTQTNLRTTRLQTETDPWQRLQLRFYEWLSVPVESGMLPLLYAATDPEVEGGEYIGVRGFVRWQGAPKIDRGQKRAYDEDLRKALWSKSEEITGVRF